MSIAAQVVILFWVVLVGVLCRRLGYFTDETIRGVTQLVVNVTLPVLTVYNMQRPFDMHVLINFLLTLLLSLAAILASIGGASLLFRHRPHDKRAVLLNMAGFSNCGFMGYPLMAALFGTLMLASCTEMVISRVLHLARRIITPLVSGVVVMIIGLSLIQVGLTSIGGGYAAMSDNTFGAPKNLLLAGVVLALIILLNRQRNPYLRVASLVIAMAAGYALAWFMGMLPESNEPMTQELIMVPTPLYYGLGIEWSLLLPLMLVFMITSLETIGDITATSDVSEQPVSGPLYMKRLKGGVLANGLNSFVSAVFNTFPNSCFGQNNGVIQLTGVASRYVGFVVALMLIVLGLFPAVSGFVQHIPEPVLGGATLVMFGTIAASGVRIVSREPLNRRAILIIALSLAVGLGVSQQPLILQFAPEWLKNLLSSGIAAGGITAIVLNLIFPPEKQ